MSKFVSTSGYPINRVIGMTTDKLTHCRRLAWLIEPFEDIVYVYRQDGSTS
ncbi:MAG: hypothetical protein H9535_11540 [Ignavibacteria bacterium]|nr:hypothetical protein [Ignavibacteria bacterium]